MIKDFEIDGYCLYNYHSLNVIGCARAYIYKPKVIRISVSWFRSSYDFKLEDFINNKDKHLTITV